MEVSNERQRVAWTTRINVRATERDTIRAIAKQECVSVATIIGYAIESFVTARSSA